MIIWRLCAFPNATQAFDGEGSRLYGGRWNEKGTRLVYTSSTLSLAALECLVHVEPGLLNRPLFQFRIEIEDGMVETLTAVLPPNWREYPSPDATKQIGTRWAASKRALVLAVPSVIIPEERNYLIDPLHPDFRTLAIDEGEPFSFDPRLWKPR